LQNYTFSVERVFVFALAFEFSTQRFALPALGRGRRSRPARKMKRRRKLLEIAAESPASGARFVGQCFYFTTTFDFETFKAFHDSSIEPSPGV
jgi:hypothetical protein